MLRVLTLPILAFALIPSFAVSQEPQDTTQHVAEAEVALLQAQNEMLRQHQDSLLATVHWALGGVAALAILLTGFGWWVNFRIYDRDKGALLRELDGTLKERVADLERRLTERSEATQNELRNLFDDREEAMDGWPRERRTGLRAMSPGRSVN